MFKKKQVALYDLNRNSVFVGSTSIPIPDSIVDRAHDFVGDGSEYLASIEKLAKTDGILEDHITLGRAS